MKRMLVLCLLMFGTVTISGQPVLPDLPPPLQLELPSAAGDAQATMERESRVVANALPESTPVTSETNIDGDPDVILKLGTPGTGFPSFSVVDNASLTLFSVRGDGYARLQRDQAAATAFDLINGNSSGWTSLRFGEGATTKAELWASGSAIAGNWANALSLWNRANGMLNFGTSNLERMRIYPNGNVAINATGAAGYNGRLYVQGGVDGATAIIASHDPTFEAGSPPQTDYAFYIQANENVQSGAANSGQAIGLYARGDLSGPGTLASATGALVATGVVPIPGTQANSGTLSNATGLRVVFLQATGSTINTGYGILLDDVLATTGYGVYQAGANDINYFAGNVGIGKVATTAKLEVEGGAKFTGTVEGGNIKAQYQDVAEWVPAASDLLDGTVVVLNPSATNEVMASATAYDTSVAGVVSPQPGLILGQEASGREKIATTGRVRVRVDATLAPIHVGDLLVTSDKPGMAMKSEPMSINGRRFHQPGTILGKALEPLERGEGEILVLLSLQ